VKEVDEEKTKESLDDEIPTIQEKPSSPERALDPTRIIDMPADFENKGKRY